MLILFKMNALLILFVAASVCWYFVFSERAREEHTRPIRDFYRLSREGQDAWKAMGLAAAIVGALLFSILFVALLMMRIAT